MMALVHRRFCVRRRLEISIFAISSLFLGQLLFISFRLETLHPTIFESTKLSALLSFQYRENNGTEKAVTQTETNKRTAQKADNNNSKAKHTTFATKKKGVRLGVKVSGNKMKMNQTEITVVNQNKMKAGKISKGMMLKRPWDPGRKGLERKQPIPIKVGLPVFVASLPKSGTTSMWQYFNCGGHRASHQYVKVNETFTTLSGQCIKSNIGMNRKPFQNCGDYNVFTDTGYSIFKPESKSYECYYPSIHGLDDIYEHYPTATIILVVRNTASWYESFANWGNGSLQDRWKICANMTSIPLSSTNAEDFQQFYEWHSDSIRNFAKKHPSLTYVEVELESNLTGQKLEQEIGIPASCWGKCLPTSKFCEKLK